MVCKYFWRLDIKGTLRVKFQVLALLAQILTWRVVFNFFKTAQNVNNTLEEQHVIKYDTSRRKCWKKFHGKR